MERVLSKGILKDKGKGIRDEEGVRPLRREGFNTEARSRRSNRLP